MLLLSLEAGDIVIHFRLFQYVVPLCFVHFSYLYFIVAAFKEKGDLRKMLKANDYNWPQKKLVVRCL